MFVVVPPTFFPTLFFFCQANLELSGSLADWLRRDAKPQHRFHAHSAAVTCLAVSMGGLQLVTGSVDKTLKVWDMATMQILQVGSGQARACPYVCVCVCVCVRGVGVYRLSLVGWLVAWLAGWLAQTLENEGRSSVGWLVGWLVG